MRSALTLKPSYYEALKRLTVELAGVNLGGDHAFLIETRLSILARKEGFDGLSAMIDELFLSGKSRLAIQVVSELLERDTHFYDDSFSYQAFNTQVFPRLLKKFPDEEIKILSFGCSSGQEPYGLAMSLDKLKKQWAGKKVTITGVDYPSSALERAKSGQYSHFDVQRGLPIRDLISYFNPKGEDWVVKPQIRNHVEFKEMHLLSNLDELGQFHAILFLNRLRDYSGPAQIRVLRGMSKIVKPDGFLMLGSKNSLKGLNYGFDPFDATAGIFTRQLPKPELPIEDPNVKKPSNRTTFDRPAHMAR